MGFLVDHEIDRVIPMIASFCALFGRLIATLHDREFCQEDVLPGATSKIMPFRMNEIICMSSFLKDLSLGLVELVHNIEYIPRKYCLKLYCISLICY